MRSETAKEAAKNLLSGGRLRNAKNYLTRNSDAQKSSRQLYTKMDNLANKTPGHLPNALIGDIKTLTTRVLGDIHPSNNSRLLSDFDNLVGQLAKTKKNSKDYKELLHRIELRTKTLESIYKNTDNGPFVQRVRQAIDDARVPSHLRKDVERCFITGKKSVGSVYKNLFFEKAHAASRADVYCDIPIAKVLKKQDKEGWLTDSNGVRTRFLIEKWDCNDCGTSKIPAWVKVMRANDKEDLAQVTHCPNCGNAKEAHEKYYGDWEYDSKGQISNATADDIVGAGPGKTKAKKAAESDETYCGFCGTIHETSGVKCGSCGAPPMDELVDKSTVGTRQAPHKPRSQPGAGARSGSGHLSSGNKSSGGSSGETTTAGGFPYKYLGYGAVGSALGGTAYYFFRSEDVEAVVTGMSWEHKVTLEKRVIVSKRGWKSSIPSAGFDIANCRDEFSHNDQVACGSEDYTISGSCYSSSSNGITTETCTPDSTGSRTVYCDDPVYLPRCDYKIPEWVYSTHRSLDGKAPGLSLIHI